MAGPRGQEESRPGHVGSRPRELPNDAGGDLYKLGEVSCEDQKGDDDDEDEDGEKKEDKEDKEEDEKSEESESEEEETAWHMSLHCLGLDRSGDATPTRAHK